MLAITSVYCVRHRCFLEFLARIGAVRELVLCTQTARIRLANSFARVNSENNTVSHNVHSDYR